MLHRYARVASTQQVARRLADAGAPHGTVVVAEEQTLGRGRLDRRWHCAAGEGLLLTVVLRVDVPPVETPLLTLGAAAALADLLDLRVKWPNDLVDERGDKLGGILAELELDGAAVRYVLLGLGLNVTAGPDPSLPRATSLARLGRPADRERLLPEVVSAILGGVLDPRRLDRWRARSYTLGRHVRVGSVEGRADALRDDGALVVGGTPVTTGEIDGG